MNAPKCPVCGSTDVVVALASEIGGPNDILICQAFGCSEWTDIPSGAPSEIGMA